MVVVRCKNDVLVDALNVNFTMLHFMWFVSHFTVGVTRLFRCCYRLAFHCWLLIYQLNGNE